MATFGPTISENIGYEAPVASPNLLGEVANLAGSFIQASGVGQPAPKPTESQVKGQALTPFAQHISDLRNSNMTDAQFTRRVRQLQREQLAATPQYSSDINRIVNETYGVQEEVVQQPIEDTIALQRQEYMNTPEGVFDLQRSVTLNEDGTLNEVETASKFNQYHLDSMSEKAAIERSNRELTLVENDVKIWKTQSEAKIGEFLPTWTKKSQGIVDSLIRQAASGAIEVDTPEEQLAFLRNSRRSLVDSYRAKAQAANIHPDVYSAQISEAVAPIDNLIDTANNMAQDQETFMKAFRNAMQYQADQILVDALGPLGVNQEFQKQAFASLGAQFYNEENFRKTVTGLTEIAKEGRFTGLDFIPDIPGQEKQSAALGASGASAMNPQVVTEMRAKQEADGGYFDTTLKTSLILIETANPNDPRGREEVFTNFSRVAALAESTSNVLGKGYLDSIFSDKNIRMYATATKAGDQSSIDLKNTLAYFSGKQIRRNQSLISRRLEAMSSDNDVWGVKQRGNTLVVTRNGVEQPVPTNLSGMGGKQGDLFKAVGNINRINSAMSRIEGVGEETSTLTFQPEADQSGEDIRRYLDSLEGGAGDVEVPGSEGEDVIQDTTYTMPKDVQEDTEFLQTVSNMAAKYNADPSIFIRAMQFETGGSFDPAQKNAAGSGATGLIQFMPATAKELGTTTEALAKMSRVEQMAYVEKYFDRKLAGVTNPTFSDVYMAILWPAAVGKPEDYVIFKKGTKAYEMNSGLDTDGSGTVTKGEAAAKAFGRTSGAVVAMPAAGQVMNSLRPEARPFVPGRVETSNTPQVPVPTSVPTKVPDGSPTASQSGSKETSEAQRTAAKQEWSQLEDQTKKLLIRLFGNEEGVIEALASGTLDKEDI